MSVLQMLSAVSTNSSSVDTTANPVDTTGATAIIIQSSTYTSAVTPTDSMGNTYSPLIDYFGSGYHSRLYICENPLTSTTHTFASPSTASTYPGIAIIVVSGSFTIATAVDQANGSIPASATSVSPGSISPSQNDETIICGLLNDNDGGNSISSVVGLDAYTFTTGNSNGGIACGIGYKIQTAWAAINPTWNVTAAKYLSSTIVSLKAATVSVSVPETGAGAEVLNIGVKLGITESGAGADTLGSGTPHSTFSLLDLGSGLDTLSLAALVSIADSGSGVDALGSVSISIALTDIGTGVDAVSLPSSIIKYIADSGIGSDAISNVQVSTSIQDSGHGTETLVMNISLVINDTATGADIVNVVKTYLVKILDSGVGTDGISIAVNMKVPDFGLGSDALNIRALIALLENATGADSISAFNTTTQLISILFSFTKRSISFAFAKRSMTFSFAQRSMTFNFVT